jgi:hypothetical protein
MQIVENKENKNKIVLSDSNINKLLTLLDSIEDISSNELGTVIKFKGNLVTITEGTQIYKSDNGHIVHLAETIHLNPELTSFDNAQNIDKQLEEIRELSNEEVKENMKKKKGNCKDCNKS